MLSKIIDAARSIAELNIMKVCCIEGCDGPSGEDPVFFDFPTSRLLRKRWTDAITVPMLPQNSVICIRHFASGDYELIRGKTRLKSRVVPTLSVGEQPNINEDTEESRDSTDTATSGRTSSNDNTRQITDKENNHNGNNKKDMEDTRKNSDIENSEMNFNKEDERVPSDSDKNNEKTNSDSNKTKNHNDNSHSDNVNSNNENGNSNNEKVGANIDKVNYDIGKIHSDNGNDNSTRDNKIENDIIKTGLNIVNNDNGNSDCNKSSANDDIITSDKNKDVNTERLDDTSGIVNNHNGNDKKDTDVNNDNGKAGKNNGTVRSRRTRCKVTAKRPRRRVSASEDSDTSSLDSVSSSPLAPPPPELEGSKDDIEGILTNYYIENKKTERQVAAMTDVLQEERREEKRGRRDVENEFRGFEQTAPVFIELSVGQNYPNVPGGLSQPEAENDCLMVLESVQCDVDPALLLATREDEELEQVDLGDDVEDDDDEPIFVDKKKEDPISLLTSSDEDDVIIQEPKIDTVEVSSADTSEDDMPLVKLVKKTKSHKNKKNSILTKLLWGRNDYYCVHCRFTTVNATEYSQHMATHSKVLQLCQSCGFTTCSRGQMQRHKMKHKNERRFQCQICTYSAKHKMSLVYHMRTHNNPRDMEIAICGTFEPTKRDKSKAAQKNKKSKIKECDKRHLCQLCEYKTNRYSDLRRHKRTVHKHDTDDDEDYKP